MGDGCDSGWLILHQNNIIFLVKFMSIQQKKNALSNTCLLVTMSHIHLPFFRIGCFS